MNPAERPERRIQRGPVSEMLNGIADARLRAHAKAEAHVAALEGKALTLDIDGTQATFSAPRRLTNGLLETRVSMPGLPKEANPFQFHNPPVIHDGREDPDGAFRAILADAVRHALSQAKGR